MDFKAKLTAFSAAEIIAALGCPRATAYQWLDGKRQPPTWQQPHWLAILQRFKKRTVKLPPER